MVNLNAKKYPLTVAKDIENLLQIMRKFVNENSNVIEVLNNDHIFYAHDISHKSFNFAIGEPTRVENRTEFTVYISPENENSLAQEIWELETHEIKDSFEDWLSIIKEFNNISFTEEETFSKFYEDEIYVDFEIIDEDATTHPFNNFQQILLYKFLSATTIYLENKHPENEEIKNICSQAIELRNEIQILTKKEFSKRFSKILARIKKFSLQTFVEISDVAKKEIYKFMLHEGVRALPKWIDNIHTLFIGHM